MTTAVLDRAAGADLLPSDYLDHVAGLELSKRSVRDRIRIAREFVSRNRDLDAWMKLPAAERAAELWASGAWPLLCYAIGTGKVRLVAAYPFLMAVGPARRWCWPVGVPMRCVGRGGSTLFWPTGERASQNRAGL